jgi:hypothetical protein
VAETKIDPKKDPSAEVPKQEALSPKELAALQKALAERKLQMGPHALDDVLEQTAVRNQDQRQEQQLYASTWGGVAGVVAALVKITDAERDLSRRKALEAMQAEMFELLAKEKKRDALRGSPFFKQLVSILGMDTAESITQKLEAAGSSSANGLQGNQAALAQASKDIAALLDKNQAVLGLRVSGETLATVIENEIKSATALIPQPTKQLFVVKPDDSLAVKAHEVMKGLERGDDRLARLQGLRTELGPERFAAMVDAYDQKYGVPLVAHIATLSTSNPSFQADMMRETFVLLNDAQQRRLFEFGRAEYAQTMALLDKQRESAKDALRDVTAEIRKTEKTLAESLGRPELGYLPDGVVRGEILEELTKRLPELAGKNWQEAYLRLKDVAGQSDPAALGDALRALNGGEVVADPEALREYIARATLQMQKLAVLDQQVDVYKNILSTTETSDEAKLRKHYALAYGNEATSHDKGYEALKTVAAAHIDNLHRKISDPALGTEERAALIRERDALEFACVKKLARDALHGSDTPDAQGAISILKNFAVGYADTQARRSDTFRGVCERLIVSIESADTLRREWQGLDVAQFANVELRKPSGQELISCIDGRPVRTDEMRLRESLPDLDTTKSEFANSRDLLEQFIARSGPTANNGRPVSKATQLEVLKAQRQAALSTDFFGHILEGSAQYHSAQAALVSVESTFASSKAKQSLDAIVTATSVLDESSGKLQKELVGLEAGPRNSFLSVDTQRVLTSGLSIEVCSKLNAKSGADAVSGLVRELDPVRGLPVDREILDAVRKAIPLDSELGRAFGAVRRGSTDATGEFETIKASLDPVSALRLDLLVARETNAVAQGNPSVAAAVVAEMLQLDPKSLFAANAEARELARVSRVERLLGALTDAERQEFLQFFEMTTQRSVGQGLIATMPNDGARGALLLRLAGSPVVTASDLQRFYNEPVPSDRTARVATLTRVLRSDAQRPAVKADEVRQVAQGLAYQYLNLRDAAKVAMSQGDVRLIGDITEKMRSIESRMSGTVARTVAQLDASYVARSGTRDTLLSLQEEAIQDEREKQVPGRPDLNALAKETAELLRSATPRTDAAFNRIRKANLTEEESLHLRALYAQESKRPSAQLEQRPLSGDLRRDLEPVAKPPTEEQDRISLLVAGGEALKRADRLSLAIAERQQNEKRQLEALSNLRASGRYDQMKDQVGAMKLTPAAREYHKAVVSGDKNKADAADLSIKAKNGDVKPHEIATFLKGKSPEDLERIKKDHPQLTKDLASASSFLNEKQMSQLMSNIAKERQHALEQAMLKSLTNPNDFAAWLDVQGGREQRRESIRNVEALLSKQPDAPRFIDGSESKIVQYVRAQRTDFREMDAHLISQIIATSLGETGSLREGTVSHLLNLREQGVARMASLDAFEQPRRTIYNAAQENLLEKRRYLAEAQADQSSRWFSAGKYDNVIALSKARIGEQDALVRPMERGMRDMETSRELVRYAFALMAKDAIAEVDRGLRPDTTDHVTTLLMQRDQKIQYKVTDQKRDAEWIASVKSTSEAIQSFDKWSTIGLGTAKVVTTIAAGIFLSPAAGLAVATAWNAGDKIYRATVGKESLKSLAKSFAWELAIDTAFAALAAVKTTTITLAGGKAVQGTAAQGLKVSKRVWEWKPFKPGLTPHSLKQADGLIVHASEFGKGAVREGDSIIASPVLQKMGGKYFDKLAIKIPDQMLRSEWAQFHVGRFVPIMQGASTPSTPTKTSPHAAKEVDDDAGRRLKLAEQNLYGSQPEKKPREEGEDVAGLKKVAKEPASSTPPQAPTPAVEITLSVNPALLREIEEKLKQHPNADVQRAVDEMRNFLSQPVVSEREGEKQLRELADALHAWKPYPELAGALDKLLTGSNPFFPFVNAPSTGYSAAPPPPPQPPPAVPPKAPDEPPRGGGGMPGPALVVAPVVRGDSQSVPRGEGNVDEQRLPLADLSRTSIGIASPRADLQGATMQEALQRAASNPIQEPRTVPNPHQNAQPVASASSMSVNEELLVTAQRAKIVDALREHVEQSRHAEVAKVAATTQAEEAPYRAAVKQKTAAREEQEISVALTERSTVKATESRSGIEAPRIVERDSERASAANKDVAVRGATSREETIEVKLSKRSSERVTTPKTDGEVAHATGEPSTVEQSAIKSQHGEDLYRAPTPMEKILGERQERALSVTEERESVRVVAAQAAAPNVARHHTDSPTAPHILSDSSREQRRLAEALSAVEEEILVAETEEIDAPSSRKAARRSKKGDDARMRSLLLQQLMDQHTAKARRERILKALIALGISEVEYRKLLIKLGEMDAARLAEQVAARTKIAEPIAMSVEAPAMKESSENVQPVAEAPRPTSKAQTSRAALYRQLRGEATGARK